MDQLFDMDFASTEKAREISNVNPDHDSSEESDNKINPENFSKGLDNSEDASFVIREQSLKYFAMETSVNGKYRNERKDRTTYDGLQTSREAPAAEHGIDGGNTRFFEPLQFSKSYYKEEKKQNAIIKNNLDIVHPIKIGMGVNAKKGNDDKHYSLINSATNIASPLRNKSPHEVANNFRLVIGSIEDAKKSKEFKVNSESEATVMTNIHKLNILDLVSETKGTQTENTKCLSEAKIKKLKMDLEEIEKKSVYDPMQAINHLKFGSQKTFPDRREFSSSNIPGVPKIDTEKSEQRSEIVKVFSRGTGLVNLSAQSSNDNLTLRPGCDIRTLEDSLRYFNFYPRLRHIEKSLEDVRRRRKTKEDHESELKQFDKDMQNLSRKYHPDKVKSRGGTEEEVFRAQNAQTALNATRKAMSILNKIFLEEIDIDHRYEFYTKLEITLLGNEDEIENHVYEVLFKISLISEIKQRHIMAEIKRFLTESQSCVESYMDGKIDDFGKHRYLALYHLKSCIRGYNKLLAEFEEVEQECRAEKLDNIHTLLRKMRGNCSKQLDHLKELMDVAELSLEETFQIFTCSEQLDDYFVLPFVCYVNLMLMCNVFAKNTYRNKLLKYIDRKKSYFKNVPIPVANDQTIFLFHLYYLASYYDGNKSYEREVRAIIGTNDIQKEKIRQKFKEILIENYLNLQQTFKVEEYNENCSNRYITEELKKCKKMKAEFEERKKEIIEDMSQIKKNTTEMNRRLDKVLETGAELSTAYHECLAETVVLRERFEKVSQKKTFK